MPDHLLVIVDRMTMAHSLESRSPLIDYKVVEYAASIPAELKLKGNTLKYLLRKVASQYLSQELINRKKVGFGFPLGIWMRTELKTFLIDLLNWVFSNVRMFSVFCMNIFPEKPITTSDSGF